MVQFAEVLTSHVTPSKPQSKNQPSTVPELKEDDEPYVFMQTLSIEEDDISKLDFNLRYVLRIPNLCGSGILLLAKEIVCQHG